ASAHRKQIRFPGLFSMLIDDLRIVYDSGRPLLLKSTENSLYFVVPPDIILIREKYNVSAAVRDVARKVFYHALARPPQQMNPGIFLRSFFQQLLRTVIRRIHR